MNAIYQEVTDKIVKELENGAIPWIKPWHSDSSADINLVTKNEYNGINRFILSFSGHLSGYVTPYWASFKQWNEIGSPVKKGEKGTKICFYTPVVKESINASGDVEKSAYPCIKTYYVFNADQVENFHYKKPAITDKVFNPIPALEDHVIKTGATVKHGGNSAYFTSQGDFIAMPNKTSFDSEANYYATLLHELTHWSGAEKRLNRELGNKFGSPKYAFEELVAELGAAFLCQDFKIQGELRHGGYIESWLRCLKDNPNAIFKAAAMAQKAADYIKAFDMLDNQAAA